MGWGGQVFVGMNNSPFVGEVAEVVKLVVRVVSRAVQGVHIVDHGIEGEVVEEAVQEELEVVTVVELAEVEIESAKTNQRGLPSGKMAPSTSSWRPFLHCLSFSGSWWSPLVFPGFSGFSGMSFSAFSSLVPWLLVKMLR